MNKLMIVLGFLLIAGISFATLSWQYPWQEYVSWRYICNYEFSTYGQYEAAYAYMQPYASPSELYSMYQYLGMMDGRLTGMVFDYYATPFRADMAGYNSANSLFRSIFNAAYREYYAATGDPGFVARNYLAGLRASYTVCASNEPFTPIPIET
jgi:hypothetical protein